MKRDLPASTGVPAISTAPARDGHDCEVSHCPVSFDRLLAQDREVQATTPFLGLPRPGRRWLAQEGQRHSTSPAVLRFRPRPSPPGDQLRHAPRAVFRARFHT